MVLIPIGICPMENRIIPIKKFVTLHTFSYKQVIEKTRGKIKGSLELMF